MMGLAEVLAWIAIAISIISIFISLLAMSR